MSRSSQDSMVRFNGRISGLVMRVYVAVVGLVCLHTHSFAEDLRESVASVPTESAPERAKAKIVFAEESYDFGKTTEGTKIAHSFLFRNEGDAPLKIGAMRQSCNCTYASLAKRDYQPGETGEVAVIVDTARRRGRDVVFMHIVSNDPVRPIVSLHCKGTVEVAVAVAPTPVDFGVIARGQAAGRIRRVFIPRAAGEMDDLRIRSSSPFVFAEALTTVASEKIVVTEVMVAVDSSAPIGPLGENITISDARTNAPTITIPVRARIDHGIVLNPPSGVFFGLVRSNQVVSRRVVLERSPNAETMEAITGRVECALGCIRAEIKPIDAVKSELNVQLQPAREGGVVKGVVKIYLNSSGRDPIEVPVYAEVVR